METDAELVQRYRTILAALKRAKASHARCKQPDSRGRAARWCGSLEFQRLHTRTEIEERGLPVPT